MGNRTLIPSYKNPRRFNNAAFNSASLIAALADYGAEAGTVFIEPGIWTMDAGFTVPKNLRLWFDEGVTWNVANGVTINLARPPIIGEGQNVFNLTGTGAVVITAAGGFPVSPEWFGALADGATNDGPAINKAISAVAGGGTVQLTPGKTYAVDPATDRIRIRSNVTLDLNGATIQRIGVNYLNNLVENFTYAPGTGYDSNITVKNGTLLGNGTNDVGTQSHASPAGNVFLFGVDGFKLENLKLDTANGDCLGWRLANNGYVDRVVGGSFGRNLFSPTSGTGNRITNCNFDFAGLTGASPGAYIDIENDAADEVSDTYWENMITKGMIFVDFWTAAAGAFAHKTRLINCVFTGDSPQTFRVQATNSVIAKSFIIGDTCRIAVAVNTAAALRLTNVAGVRCFAKLANDDPAGQGTSKAIWIQGPTDDFVYGGQNAVDGFSSGIDAIDFPLTNSRFVGAHIGDVHLRQGSDSNRFIGCKIGTMDLVDSDSNQFKDCNITGTLTLTRSASNDFSGGELPDLIVNEATSLNNRFRVDNRITGAKTFNGGATWLGQLFELQSGEFVPTLTGSTGGAATLTTAWGRYNVVGDILYYSMSLAWNASTGTGDQRINLNLPDSIVPVDAISPSRWAASLLAAGFAFTGTQLVANISGGNGFIAPYGLSNVGVATGVPANLAAGNYEEITGFFRIR